MVLYGLVEILKLKSKPLMNGRGYGVRSGRGYGVMAFKSEQSLSDSVTKVGIELLGRLKNNDLNGPTYCGSCSVSCHRSYLQS